MKDTKHVEPMEPVNVPADTRRRRSREPASTSSEIRQEPTESRLSRIAKRAHEIYEARGGQDGKAIDDWLQAEREIDASS
jgi:Protein of unknown function (DUF2934)